VNINFNKNNDCLKELDCFKNLDIFINNFWNRNIKENKILNDNIEKNTKNMNLRNNHSNKIINLKYENIESRENLKIS
jgi:hypothetical protein